MSGNASSEKPYLDERSLGRFLRARLDSEIMANCRVPGIARLFRPDYRSERLHLIVEFDGDQHYCHARHVLEDTQRDATLIEAGYRIIRIPYFVQLHPAVIEDLFGQLIADHSSFKDFPHGFIADTVVFPADFCELGIERFRHDLERFAFIRTDILGSLASAASQKGDWRLVYPPSLHALI
jgi:hypothetical protein